MHRPYNGLALVLSLSALSLCVTGPGSAADEPAAAQATEAPQAMEQEYLKRDYLFASSTEIEAYLASIIDKLLQTRGAVTVRPRVLIYSVEEFSARADVSDNILVSLQTLRMLESEDELAALLGHELAHIVNKHAQKKSFLRSFPVGVETMGTLAAAADQMKSADQAKSPAQQGSQPGELSSFAKDSLRTTQGVSLFWSDLLAPNWNRKQERQADREGLDMMRAAGYDPAAFATLFSKLHAAQLKRSERMEVLRKVMIERAQKAKAAAATSDMPAGFAQTMSEMRNTMSEKAITGVFDGIARASADYDSPEQRQELLAKHANETPQPRRDKTARSPRFQQVLREGPGGALLKADEAAIRTMNALNAGDVKAAQEAVATLLPKKEGAKAASAKGKAKGKPSAAQTAKNASPASPHLNLAIGAWHVSQRNPQLGEERVKDWLASSRAPTLASLWRASHQSERKEYAPAIETLEEGARRVGSAAAFLPHMVTLAKLAQNEPAAEQYTRRCEEEERKEMSTTRKITNFLKSDEAPTGLYAECVRRLGRIPPSATVAGQDDAPKKDTGMIQGLREKLNGNK